MPAPFVVTCENTHGERIRATSRQFWNATQAEAYARTLAPSLRAKVEEVNPDTPSSMQEIPAADALERLANIADTAANVLQASAPIEADRFKADREVARAGLINLRKLLVLYARAADALDDYHRDGENTQGPSPLADEMRAALNPPPNWVAEAVAPVRRAGP